MNTISYLNYIENAEPKNVDRPVGPGSSGNFENGKSMQLLFKKLFAGHQEVKNKTLKMQLDYSSFRQHSISLDRIDVG